MKNDTDNLKKKTINGLFWSANSKFSVQLFNLIVTAVLARILLPEDFGLVAMSVIFIGLISMINETGFTTALVQRDTLDDGHLHTAFWTNIVTGVVLYLASFLLAPLLAEFFRNEAVEPIIKVAGVSFIISSFTVVHRSLMSRNMEFDKFALTEIAGAIVAGISALYLAINGFGFWSLVAKNIINDFIVVLLTLKISPWKPLFYFSTEKLIDLFGFGANVVGANFLNYLRQNLDYIVIGRLMNAELLGYYTLAYTLAVFPATKITPMITRVLVPAFSRLQNENDTFKRGYIKLVFFLSAIMLPALVGLAAVSPELIIQIYGEKWSPAILPLQILCLLGIFEFMTPVMKTVMYSKGRPKIELIMNIVKIPITLLCIFIGSFYGIVGVASALAIISFFYFVTAQHITNSLIGLSWKTFLNTVRPLIITSVSMGCIISIYKYIIADMNYNNGSIILLTSIIIGIISFVLILSKLDNQIFLQIKTQFYKLKKKSIEIK